MDHLDEVQVVHILRGDNTEADSFANLAMDDRDAKCTIYYGQNDEEEEDDDDDDDDDDADDEKDENSVIFDFTPLHDDGINVQIESDDSNMKLSGKRR